MQFRKILKQGTKRGAKVVHGRSQSPYLVKLENDVPAKPWRRVYEDWNQLDTRGSSHPRNWAPVPLVLVIGGEVITLNDEQRRQLEAA